LEKPKLALVQGTLALGHLSPSHPSKLAKAKAQELAVVLHLPAEV
jgi:hypothetical protein